jgi:hypothetical protein
MALVFYVFMHLNCSGNTAVGIATHYVLNDRGIRVRVAVGAKFSFVDVVQTGSGAHPMGTGGSFLGE